MQNNGSSNVLCNMILNILINVCTYLFKGLTFYHMKWLKWMLKLVQNLIIREFFAMFLFAKLHLLNRTHLMIYFNFSTGPNVSVVMS